MSADMDLGSLAVAAVPTVGAISAAVFAYRASKNANRIEEKKVDQEAYERAIQFYKDQLEYLQQQVDRLISNQEKMNEQLTKVTTQLDLEKSASSSLKEKIRVLETLLESNQVTIGHLQTMVTQLQAQLKSALSDGLGGGATKSSA